MYKLKAEKEIFYIFVWLVGIIFVYTMVHLFILEPSGEKSQPSHIDTPHHDEKERHKKNHQNLQKSPISLTADKSTTVKQKSFDSNNSVESIEKKGLQVDKASAIPSKVLTISMLPKTSSKPVDSNNTESETKENHVEHLSKKSTLTEEKRSRSETQKRRLSTDIGTKRIESQRQQLREEIYHEIVEILGH